MPKKQVLIAHQSTIPHYRVSFYDAVNRLKPSWWDFRVVFDEDAERRRRLFVEPTDPSTFGFKTIPVRTIFLELLGRRALYQTFVRRAGRYDLIVLEDAVHNLAYPAVRIWRGRGTAIAYWGHGKDHSVARAVGWKRLAENFKRRLVKNSEGYFAYTAGVQDLVAEKGVDPGKIYVLNNTIDIEAERASYEPLIESRSELRRAEGLSDKKVLLHVGRLNKWKRLDFLGEAVKSLRADRPEYHLVVIGGGEQAFIDSLRQALGEDGFTHCGVIVERSQLARWYALSDAYVHPGDVGLGVLQTLCYDLTPVVVDRPTHNPEYEYLNNTNSVIAPPDVSAAGYAREIARLCSDHSRWAKYRESAWPSINHLTVDQMAQNFIDGVNAILGGKRSNSNM
jgi:glycosyltransferase involved in cell wall biosynthesis